MYMGDKNWWNKRFEGRNQELMKHDIKLDEDLSLFPSKGKVLDVACGDGRNAIYLSKLRLAKYFI